jgi:hypothetical protein
VYVFFISSVKRSSSLSDVFQWTVHAFHPVNAASIIFVYLWAWSQYILYCVPRPECHFYICISEKICYFPLFFTAICKCCPFVLWFCESTCVFVFSGGGNLLITFMSYSLCRNMFLMVFMFYPLLHLLLDMCVNVLVSS